MINLYRLTSRLFPDRRPEREKAREREFIRAANSFKTLRVTQEGGIFIDPEELREQIVASREQLKHLVHKPGGIRPAKSSTQPHNAKTWCALKFKWAPVLAF